MTREREPRVHTRHIIIPLVPEKQAWLVTGDETEEVVDPPGPFTVTAVCFRLRDFSWDGEWEERRYGPDEKYREELPTDETSWPDDEIEFAEVYYFITFSDPGYYDKTFWPLTAVYFDRNAAAEALQEAHKRRKEAAKKKGGKLHAKA